MTTWMRPLAAAACTIAAAATAFAQGTEPRSVAITNARIITGAGADIDRGTVLIRDGMIEAVGGEVELPFDAVEYDAEGMVVMPGMVDAHSSSGLDQANESLPVLPFLDVYDAIDPSRLYFENALRDGVTTIHVVQGNNTVIAGVSRAVMPIGLTPDEMTVEPDVALKLAVSARPGSDAMVQRQTMRSAFRELDEALGDAAEEAYEEQQRERGRRVTVLPEEARRLGLDLVDLDDLDERFRNIERMRRGELAAFVYAGDAMDVGPALDLAEAQGFLERTVLIIGPDAHKAADRIADAGRPVVIGPELYSRERDPFTGELREVFAPAVLHEAGVPFALLPSPETSLAERFLNYQAALCVRNGVPRDVAIASITSRPAEMLGLGERLGTIEPGKVGTLVVMSGDPLEFSSHVEMVFLTGVLAYERSKDRRLRELLDLDDAPPAGEISPADDTAGRPEGSRP